MKQLALYVHFPYCEKKCPYCDFNSHVSNRIDHEAFTTSYENEIDYFANLLDASQYQLTSIFFGGGTPSLMDPKTVESVILKARNIFSTFHDIEITLETNPSSFESDKFQSFKSAGVNRISIGVQALNDDDLQKLGRVHDAASAISAVHNAAKIFDNYSIDLIYAREGQNIDQWTAELNFALKNLTRDHVSLYTLTIEKGTPFFKLAMTGNLVLPENSDDFYLHTNQILSDNGFTRYETSNYAKNNKESVHNLTYWTGGEYIGIGPGAHGRINVDDARHSTQNISSPDQYLKKMAQGQNALQQFYKLSAKDIAYETASMGLRTKYGCKLDYEFFNKSKALTLQSNGILHLSNDVAIPTQQGMNLTDQILQYLII